MRLGRTEVAGVSPGKAGSTNSALLRDLEALVPGTVRSGGTSLSGQASTHGMMLDIRRNFREIEVLSAGERVRVQPGATVRAVNARLAPYQRKLGPDPASEAEWSVTSSITSSLRRRDSQSAGGRNSKKAYVE